MKLKRALFLLGFCTGTFIVKAQQPAVANDPLGIASTHDFGRIQQGRPVTYSFPLTNNGKDTLRIENVAASCGCTTPQWSRDPILPGGKSLLTVGYNAAAEGVFEKSITLYYNGGKTRTVYIKGEVTKATPSVPANNSVQLLKQINQ
ncbi:DUF1573 domain-containing protein [Flavihumibacter rivuli]|uniref:DUF1573 domain-containing protein n=1 Tax=Flavihumibacter rivuli TaxID=2838156 RepID=UPI001BDE0894|nr:DUF1573 domain-containing protein [Flavihumibacter rivuli]ULQ56824.1 DUF1573 domain-containing protein [Flavihumibacter rivuli]